MSNTEILLHILMQRNTLFVENHC